VADDLLALAAELQRRGEAFALATVVRCEAPTSAKPGAKALVREDGRIVGWVGGACAEPVVVREARQALRDGRPRLVGLVGESRPPHGGLRLAGPPSRTEGLDVYPMTCHSGGTLEIYVEPHLPKPLLLVVGHGPAVETLASLARAADYAVTVATGGGAREELARLALTTRASVVVATHGNEDEDVLEQVLRTDAGYVSLVASRRRAAVVLDALAGRGVPAERLGRLKAPAGLDIGAVTPEEIAVSVLAEIVHHHRSRKTEPAGADAPAASPEGRAAAPEGRAAAPEGRDPICGMRVEIATAAHRSEVAGRAVYFCCAGCKATFDRDPQRHLAALR
jgi:xanthine dehydrogenase accessory factor